MLRRIKVLLGHLAPDDYFSVDDFYKVYSYACFYKSDVSEANRIKAEEVYGKYAG